MSVSVTVKAGLGGAALLCVLAFSPLCARGQGATSRRKPAAVRAPLVGVVRDRSVYEGCGCYFSLPHSAGGHFFIADMGRRAWMNLAGRDVELELVGASHMSLQSARGRRMRFRFRAAGVRVSLRLLVTRTSTYEADYEPARYSVTAVVRAGRRQVIRAFGQACGC